MKTIKSVYFAAPLFTQAEWLWNAALANHLTNLGLEIILPQARATPMLMGDESFNADELFQDNISGIESADCILAIFDQADPDSGTCWECGYAFKLGKPIFGLRSDLRKSGDDDQASINLMLSKSCLSILEVPFNKREDIEWVAKEIAFNIKSV